MYENDKLKIFHAFKSITYFTMYGRVGKNTVLTDACLALAETQVFILVLTTPPGSPILSSMGQSNVI